MLIFYALSPGPVLKYFGPNPPNAVAMLYVPLIYLYGRVPAVHNFYEWYLKLWGV
ncbi:MAG TPA: hypothetical protein VFV96_10055 [Verrucomicrobiae bacterium]|nr:hypothetical protein [Verrucomicrobiae bacterium]